MSHLFTTNAVDVNSTVPNVLCPMCGGELTYTDSGAFCDWDTAYVPITHTVVLEDIDWIDDASDDHGD